MTAERRAANLHDRTERKADLRAAKAIAAHSTSDAVKVDGCHRDVPKTPKAPSSASANLKAAKMRNLAGMADLEFVVEERSGKFVVVVYSDTVGTVRLEQLTKANVIVEPSDIRPGFLKEKHMEAQTETTSEIDTAATEKANAAAAKAEKKAADKRERERAKEEKAEAAAVDKAVKTAAREAARAEKDAAKAEKPAKEPTTPGTWREGFDRSAIKKQAMLAEGKPIFRAGSKREQLHKLLEAGVTLDDAMATLSWDKSTTSASFYEIAQLVGRKLNKSVEADKPAVYSLA